MFFYDTHAFYTSSHTIPTMQGSHVKVNCIKIHKSSKTGEYISERGLSQKGLQRKQSKPSMPLVREKHVNINDFKSKHILNEI